MKLFKKKNVAASEQVAEKAIISNENLNQKDNKASGNFWGKFKELTLGVQIFNAFNINNTIANQWISDVNSSPQLYYPVPVRLTGRFFNVKLEFKL